MDPIFHVCYASSCVMLSLIPPNYNDGPHRMLVHLPLAWWNWYHPFILSMSSFRTAGSPDLYNSTPNMYIWLAWFRDNACWRCSVVMYTIGITRRKLARRILDSSSVRVCSLSTLLNGKCSLIPNLGIWTFFEGPISLGSSCNWVQPYRMFPNPM